MFEATLSQLMSEPPMKSISLLFALLLLGCNAETHTATANATPDPSVDQSVEATETPTSQPASQPSADGEEAHEDHGEHDGIAPSAGALAGWEHFGAPFTLTSEPVTVDQAIETCVGTESPCLVTGTVESVCQRSGCWFTVASESTTQEVRIRMQDYGFFVPRDATGQTVTFEGILTAETISQETLQHYAEDEAIATGQPAEVITGPAQAYQFMISGAEINRGNL